MRSLERRDNSEFQAVVGYRDPEASPYNIVRGTCDLLDLHRARRVFRPPLVLDFISEHTIPYITRSEQGSTEVYSRTGEVDPSIDLEARESAGLTYVLFAWMHEYTTSELLPGGFSRRGMLKAPSSREEFLARTRELKLQLFRIFHDDINWNHPLIMDPPLLRTYWFFRLGRELPLKFAESAKEREEEKRQKFNELLDDLDISV